MVVARVEFGTDVKFVADVRVVAKAQAVLYGLWLEMGL